MWVEDSGMMREKKTKVTSLEIIVTGTKENPYFEIKYKEVGKEDYCIGYGSYNLNNVLDWKEECFEIINQVAEEYKSKAAWIPCDVRYPDTDEYILISFENFSIPCVGRYEEDEEGGAFFVGDDDGPCTSYGLVVNAWMQLPKPYKSQEDVQMSNGDVIRSMNDEELANVLLKIDDIGKYLKFCGHSTKCDEILDAGELIPDGMCKECLLKWLKEECVEWVD